MGAETGENTRAVTVNIPHNAKVLRGFRERNRVSVDINGRYYFRIFDIQLLPRGGKDKKFGLFWNEGDIVALAILQCEMEEVLELLLV